MEEQQTKHRNQLVQKQQFLIQAKGDQIKMLMDQLMIEKQRTENFESVQEKNKELTKQNARLQGQVEDLESTIELMRSERIQELSRL
jgi:hypothetical protein